MSDNCKNWNGSIGAYEYEAWKVQDPYKPDYIKARIYKSDKILRSQMPGTKKTRIHHSFTSVEDLRRFLYHKVRRQKVPEDNSVGSHPQWRKRLEKRRERRERWREPEIKTDYYNGSAHHLLIS